MAGVSHLKNKKEAKQREKIQQLMYKCGGDPVYANKFIELMESSDIEIGKTDMRRLERIAAEDGSIETDEFLKFGQRSEAVKEYIEKFMRSGPPIDKAELAFKAIDRDNSGSISVGELGQLSGNMSKKKVEALMAKLDTDGDGKITLEEFRGLFKEIKQ